MYLIATGRWCGLEEPGLAWGTSKVIMHPAGTILIDRYRVEATLGQGGMGTVYLARDFRQHPSAYGTTVDTMVAIKQMVPDGAEHDLREAAMRQFRKEAEILHSLEHPRLPAVSDFFEVGGTPYLVMEYIKGRTLASVVETEPPLPESLVREWAAKICEVLDYLHTHDPVVVFRDLKPGNVILDVDGDIRIIDFGISKLLGPTAQSNTNTYARGCVSPGFTAPEQYAGKSEPRSDVYSLGATLYYLLSGQIPAGSVERIADPNSLQPLHTLRPDVTEAFCKGIETLMTIRSKQRPASLAEIRETLNLNATFVPTGDAPAPPPGEWTPEAGMVATVNIPWLSVRPEAAAPVPIPQREVQPTGPTIHSSWAPPPPPRPIRGSPPPQPAEPEAPEPVADPVPPSRGPIVAKTAAAVTVWIAVWSVWTWPQAKFLVQAFLQH